MTRLDRLRERLARWPMPRVAAGIVALLMVPSLFVGLSADDYTHWLRARGGLPYGSRLDVFDFCDGAPATLAFLKDAGIVSWWAHDHMAAHFFRPLTSLTHFVDYNAWPGAPWLMHAENLAISAAVAALAAVLYRRLFDTRGAPAGVAGLAALLYAIDAGHGYAGWVAFRNGALAAALGLLALLLHDRWRRDGWRPGRVLGPVTFALALGAGESALATFAFVVAYAVTIDGGTPRARIASVLPHAAVAAAWQAVYRLGGYGVVGSGIYLDPGREPLRFLREAPEHAAALLLGQLAMPPADAVLAFSAPGRRVLFLAGVAVVVLFAWLVAPLLRPSRDGVGPARVARFFAVGGILALAPICATIPSNRLLFFVSFAAIGLVAQLASAGTALPRARRVATRAFLVMWMVTHALLGPLLFLTNSLAFWGLDAAFGYLSRGLPSQAELAGRTVVIVNAPDLIVAVYRFMIPRDGRLEHGARGLVMSLTYGHVHVTRGGPLTLTVRADDDLTAVPLASLFRGESYPVRQGEVFHAGPTVIHVDAVAPNGHPSAATFTLDAPLEDPRLYWIAWDHTRFVPFTPPAVAAEVDVGN